MSNWSTFTLPFEALELPRFLLTLEQALSSMPTARLTFVELDAEDPDLPMASIELSMARALVEKHRAEDDPVLPEDEEILTAELTLENEDGETTLAIDLERNMLVMPVLVKIVEDVLRRLEVIADEEDEESDDDEEDDEDEADDDEEDDEEESDADADDEDADADEDADGEPAAIADEAFVELREIAERAFGKTHVEGSSFLFDIAWEEPARQKTVRARAFVPAFAAAEEPGASWVALESEVCPLAALAPVDAVDINTASDFQISLDGERYVMTIGFPVLALDGTSFVEMALALAEQADLLGIAIAESKRARSSAKHQES